MANTKTISLCVWKTLFRETLRAFPKVWWRIASVTIFTMLTLIVGTGVFAGIGYVSFRGSFENILANISFGGSLVGIIPLILLAIVWALFILVFSINGKNSNTLVLKNYVKKTKRSPFKIYFVDSWNYLWRQILIALRVLWYLIWPLFLLVIVGGGIMNLSKSFVIESIGSVIIVVVYGIVLFVGLVLLLWRGFHVVFTRTVLVHFDKDSKSTFTSAIQLVKGNWWGVFLSVISFFVVVNLVRVFFLVPQSLFFDDQEFNIFALLDFLFSLFVLAPLLISFMYLFMLHLSKTKKIKL